MSKMGNYVLGMIEDGDLDPQDLDYPEPNIEDGDEEQQLINDIVSLQDDDIPF